MRSASGLGSWARKIRAEALRLELAADYLVMAAWLAYLKSALLLPRDEQEEPDEDALHLDDRDPGRIQLRGVDGGDEGREGHQEELRGAGEAQVGRIAEQAIRRALRGKVRVHDHRAGPRGAQLREVFPVGQESQLPGAGRSQRGQACKRALCVAGKRQPQPLRQIAQRVHGRFTWTASGSAYRSLWR